MSPLIYMQIVYVGILNYYYNIAVKPEVIYASEKQLVGGEEKTHLKKTRLLEQD